MQISSLISWTPVKWPGASNATHYAVFVNGAATATYLVTAPATGSAAVSQLVSYDDASGTVFTVRPTDNATPTPNYGPATNIVISSQPLNNRAWLMSYVRKTMTDRIDAGTAPAATPILSDDELRDYVNDALRNYSLHFPPKKTVVLTLVAAQRQYTLPTDFKSVVQARYDRVVGNFTLYLTEMPYKGGESTASSWIGFPKLGILQSPYAGRFYNGHYEIVDGQLSIDFDPAGDGDTITLHYEALLALPTSETAPLGVPDDDLELLALYAEGKAWKTIEGRDANLSRFTDRTGRRDDLPTERMSTRLFNAYQQLLKERRTLRPSVLRLVRNGG